MNLANKAFQLDLDLLKRLFETGEHDHIHEPCGVIEQLNSRRPHCGKPLTSLSNNQSLY